jgi:hypothetical protein
MASHLHAYTLHFVRNKDKYFLLETKQQGDQRKMERRVLLLLLRKITGDPTFTTKIMDLS